MNITRQFSYYFFFHFIGFLIIARILESYYREQYKYIRDGYS